MEMSVRPNSPTLSAEVSIFEVIEIPFRYEALETPQNQVTMARAHGQGASSSRLSRDVPLK